MKDRMELRATLLLLNKRRHKCNLCNKDFRTRQQLKVHHRSHTGERPFPCPECQYSSSTQSNMKSHLCTMHNYDAEMYHAHRIRENIKRLKRQLPEEAKLVGEEVSMQEEKPLDLTFKPTEVLLHEVTNNVTKDSVTEPTALCQKDQPTPVCQQDLPTVCQKDLSTTCQNDLPTTAYQKDLPTNVCQKNQPITEYQKEKQPVKCQPLVYVDDVTTKTIMKCLDNKPDFDYFRKPHQRFKRKRKMKKENIQYVDPKCNDDVSSTPSAFKPWELSPNEEKEHTSKHISISPTTLTDEQINVSQTNDDDSIMQASYVKKKCYMSAKLDKDPHNEGWNLHNSPYLTPEWLSRPSPFLSRPHTSLPRPIPRWPTSISTLNPPITVAYSSNTSNWRFITSPINHYAREVDLQRMLDRKIARNKNHDSQKYVNMFRQEAKSAITTTSSSSASQGPATSSSSSSSSSSSTPPSSLFTVSLSSCVPNVPSREPYIVSSGSLEMAHKISTDSKKYTWKDGHLYDNVHTNTLAMSERMPISKDNNDNQKNISLRSITGRISTLPGCKTVDLKIPSASFYSATPLASNIYTESVAAANAINTLNTRVVKPTHRRALVYGEGCTDVANLLDRKFVNNVFQNAYDRETRLLHHEKHVLRKQEKIGSSWIHEKRWKEKQEKRSKEKMMESEKQEKRSNQTMMEAEKQVTRLKETMLESEKQQTRYKETPLKPENQEALVNETMSETEKQEKKLERDDCGTRGRRFLASLPFLYHEQE